MQGFVCGAKSKEHTDLGDFGRSDITMVNREQGAGSMSFAG